MNITTSCKDCIWAEYEGKTQTGCEFNKLDQYREAGKQVTEAYDEEKEFFIINSPCFYGRLPAWGEKDKVKLERELIQTFPYQLVFVDYGEYCHNKEQFEHTIADFMKNQSGTVSAISVIRRKTSAVSILEMTEVLNNYAKKWKIMDVTDENQVDDYYIMQVIREIKSTFYVKINNFNMVDDYGKLIHSYMNEKNIKFAILQANGNDIVNCLAHEHYQGGSFGVHLKDIVDHRAKEQICTI